MVEYGLDWLKKEAMENVSLDEISEKDIQWCVAKWHLVMGLTLGQQLAEKVFEDPEEYYGHLMVRLEQRIKALGGKVVPMRSAEIPNVLSRFVQRILFPHPF